MPCVTLCMGPVVRCRGNRVTLVSKLIQMQRKFDLRQIFRFLALLLRASDFSPHFGENPVAGQSCGAPHPAPALAFYALHCPRRQTNGLALSLWAALSLGCSESGLL